MGFKHVVPFRAVFHSPGHRLCGDRWTRLRRRFLRAHPSCASCGKPGEHVHHVIPRADNPELCYAWDNLRTLCRPCHNHAHGRKLDNDEFY